MAQSSTRPEIRIKGIAAAPGIARGAAFVFLQSGLEVSSYPVEEKKIPGEIARFKEALGVTRRQISALREKVKENFGEKEAGIFDAHLVALEDPALVDETLRMLSEEKLNVDYCFNITSKKLIKFFSQLKDEYLRGRAGDVRDIAQRILHNLLGSSRNLLSEIVDGHIIVSEDLTPSDTAGMKTESVRAIVMDDGNRTSHAVIMSRSLRIPAVVGLLVATEKIATGDDVLVDGYDGVVYVNPSEETLYRYGRLEKRREEALRRVMDEVSQPDVTRDGLPFVLSANVNGTKDMKTVWEHRARGIGLFRTESIFLKDPSRVPNEEEQFEYYKALIEAAAPASVVVRTLDIGGDKPHGALLPGLTENNPFMGFRAIRLCLEDKTAFRTQLRAILRASAFGRVKVMFPMISSLDELLQAQTILWRVLDELKSDGIPIGEDIETGAMIEIPSAAIMADLLAEHCDFFSIGTNDLVQYMLAVDRGNGRIAHLYEPCNPAVLRVLRDVIAAAKRKNIPASVCGEMAGDPMFAPLLIALGADSLSMTPTAIPEIRFLLRHVTRDELDALAMRVYAECDPARIKQILREFSQAHSQQ